MTSKGMATSKIVKCEHCGDFIYRRGLGRHMKTHEKKESK